MTRITKKRKPRTFIHSKKPLPTSPVPQPEPKKDVEKKGEKRSFWSKLIGLSRIEIPRQHDQNSKEQGASLRQEQSTDLPRTKEHTEEREIKSATRKRLDHSHLYVIIAGVLIILNILALGVVLYFQQKISRDAVLTQFSTDQAIATVPQLTDTDLAISARSAIIFDTKSRTAIYQKNDNFRFAPASTTKIMTATIALEHYNLGQVVTVPESVNQVVGSKMNLVAGEKITIRNLLYGMLLPSGNDAAYVLATLDPGGVPGFVKKMNQKAKELKMDNTKFVDSSGYDDANYTSPFDLARLTAYALQNPMFQQIVQTRAITVTDVTGKIVHPLENLNKLLANSDVLGVKTGFTNEAGEVLVTSFDWQGRNYIIVVMHSQDRFADTQVLINAIENSVQVKHY